MNSDRQIPEHGLDEIKKKLYERGGGEFKVRRSDLDPINKGYNRAWLDETAPAKAPANIWFKLLLGSFVFFLAAVGLAYYIFSHDRNVVSERNIDIVARGPVTIKAADRLNLEIGLTNKNAVGLEQVELTTIWPSGTKDPNSGAHDLTYQTQKVGQISSGETVNVSAKGSVFGKENEELEIKIVLRYHLVGSNNLFVKEADYRLKITASPIDLAVTMPPEINSDQEFTVEIKASSNADSPVSNVLTEVVFPPGYKLKSASPEPSYGSNKWFFGDMATDAVRTIRLTGIIEGQSEQLRAFEFRLGAVSDKQAQSINFLYNDVFKSLTIKRPFLALEFGDKSNSGGELTQSPGQVRKYSLDWANNLPVSVEDVSIQGTLSGSALDKTAIQISGGYYSSIDNKLLWDKNTYKNFSSIDPSQSGTFDLVMTPLPVTGNGRAIKNPFIAISLNISGTRVSEGFSREKVETDLARTIKVDTFVELTAQSGYDNGPFKNSGPVPPKMETATTYTIDWALLNSSNDLKNGTVIGTLPLGVSWVGMTSPGSENVSYDDKTRQIVWNLGDVKAGTGIEAPLRRAYFQVKLIPSADQVGQAPLLVKNVEFQGVDIWSGSTISRTGGAISTFLRGDSSFVHGNDIVVR